MARPPLGRSVPPRITSGRQTFAGYILFDAWIGNSDRHHENWALIGKRPPGEGQDIEVYLAPTYDHASSLGRNESDQARKMRLNGKDQGYTLEAYATKCKSAFYEKVDDPKPMTTFQAAQKIAAMEPEASAAWIEAIAGVSLSTLQALFARIPSERISPLAVEFAIAVLQFNQDRLLSLLEKRT